MTILNMYIKKLNIYRSYILQAIKHEIPTTTATIKELVNITCLWWYNICIICDLKERFSAPFGGLISSLVAKGEKA